MKANEFLTNILCISLILSNITPAIATYTEQDYTYTENETNNLQDTQVLYEKASSYFIRIPKIITLGQDKTCFYSVEVKGDISSDKQVYVSPIDSLKNTENLDFYMTDESVINKKQNIVAIVTQNKFYWDFKEVTAGYIETENNVSAPDLSAGNWKGTFDFEINMHNISGNGETPSPDENNFILTTDGDIELEAGTSYQLNAYINGIKANDEVKWQCDNPDIIIEKGLISIPDALEAGDKITITISKDDKSVELVITTKVFDPYFLAPENAYNDWNYTLDEENKIITLNYYIGSKTDVIVYANYIIKGITYKTQLASNTNLYHDSKYMFNCPNNGNIQSIKFSKNIDTSDVTGMNFMFYCCQRLTNLDISNFDTSNVTDMRAMFQNCDILTSLNVNSFDTSKVTDMSYMFYGCSRLTSLDVSNFNTSKVTNMSYMFRSCSTLTSIDLSSFDTHNVTNMYSMFAYNSYLKTIYVTNSKWDTSQANTSTMFNKCGTSSVTYK